MARVALSTTITFSLSDAEGGPQCLMVDAQCGSRGNCMMTLSLDDPMALSELEKFLSSLVDSAKFVEKHGKLAGITVGSK